MTDEPQQAKPTSIPKISRLSKEDIGELSARQKSGEQFDQKDWAKVEKRYANIVKKENRNANIKGNLKGAFSMVVGSGLAVGTMAVGSTVSPIEIGALTETVNAAIGIVTIGGIVLANKIAKPYLSYGGLALGALGTAFIVPNQASADEFNPTGMDGTAITIEQNNTSKPKFDNFKLG